MPWLPPDPLASVWQRIPIALWRKLGLLALALLVWVTVFSAIWMRIDLIMLVPLVVLVALLTLLDYRPIFWLLIFALPLSTHLEFGDLALDMPTEPLMMLLLAIFLLNVCAGRQFQWTGRIYGFHLLVGLILFWIAYTSLLSLYPMRSLKFLLAKLWYVATFVYMAERIIRSEKDVQRIFWVLFWPTVAVIIFVSIKHAAVGFAFGEAHMISKPFFLNGVNYSAMMTLLVPWFWFARTWYTPKSLQWYLITIGMGLVLLGVITAFKRMGWLAVMAMPVVYVLITRKWFERVIYAGVVLLVVMITYLTIGNNFYYFAPNYQTTIWHKDDLEGHLSATFDGTEISGMERFYRWVAAKNMVEEMPLTGSGPSTFNQVYPSYTDDAFRTYVSENEEQSTCHNYYLQTFAEQGFPGGILFLLLNVYMLIQGYRAYHGSSDPLRQSVIIMVMLCLVGVQMFSLLNEQIEVDKVGPFFWLCLTLLHLATQWNARDEALAA
jgi:O-antigen ligase